MHIHQMRERRFDSRSPAVALAERIGFLFRPPGGQQRVVRRQAQDTLNLAGWKTLLPKRALGTSLLVPANGDEAPAIAP